MKPLRTYAALEKRQKEPTTDENNDLEWAGTISIGTPAQYFLIDFHTAVRINGDYLYPASNGLPGRTWSVVPELQDPETRFSHNPFSVDMYLIGHMFAKEFLAVG